MKQNKSNTQRDQKSRDGWCVFLTNKAVTLICYSAYPSLASIPQMVPSAVEMMWLCCTGKNYSVSSCFRNSLPLLVREPLFQDISLGTFMHLGGEPGVGLLDR